MVQGVVVDFNANLARWTSNLDKATNDLSRFQKNSQRMSKNVSRAFGAAGFGIGIYTIKRMSKEITGLADSYTKINSQLRVATDSQVEYLEASENVHRISKTSQADIVAVTQLYARLSNSLRDNKVEQHEIADISETVALALKVGGAASTESASAMLQLSQAFGKGTLDGQEFKAVAESAPNLLRILAKSMGVNRGELKDLASQGRITTEVMKKAFTDTQVLGRLREQAKSVQTVSGEAQKLENIWVDLMGEMGVAELYNVPIRGLTEITEHMVEATKEGGNLKGVMAGVGDVLKTPFDLYFGSIEIGKSQDKIIELQGDLTTLKRSLKTGEGGGLLNRMLYGEQDEIKSQIRIVENQLAVLRKSGKEIDALFGASTLKKSGGDDASFSAGIDQKARDKALADFQKFIEERRKAATQAREEDYQQIQRWKLLADPASEYREEIQNIQYSMAQVGGVSREVGEANIRILQAQIDATLDFADASKGAADEINSTYAELGKNLQRDFGDVLYDGMNGTFTDIGQLFKQMLFRMAADAAAQQITQSFMGLLGGAFGGPTTNVRGVEITPAPSFAGGGFTGLGSRSGGLDGKGGFGAILHPNETVVDHAKGGRAGMVINYSPITHIDSRTDRNEVVALVEQANQRGKMELADELQRAGVI